MDFKKHRVSKSFAPGSLEATAGSLAAEIYEDHELVDVRVPPKHDLVATVTVEIEYHFVAKP